MLVGQSRRSGGGLWYADADEYAVMLDLLARNAAARRMRWAARGRRYVARRVLVGPGARASGSRPSPRPAPGAAPRDRDPLDLRRRRAALPAGGDGPRAGCSSPGGWIGIATIPLGFCVLVTLLYPIGWVAGSTIATPVVLAIIVVGLVVAVVLRLRRAEPGDSSSRRVWPGTTGLVVLGAGIVAGVLVLAATIDQGFPTTIAVANNDGWGYATLVDWLQHDPMPDYDVGPSIADPLTLVPWTTTRLHFGVGFEHIAAMVATLLGREGYEVVNATAAVGLAAAVGGWAALARSLRRDLRPATAVLVAVAVASPALVIPFVENYTTQFVALCLWPFALAMVVRLASEPGWRRLLLAAISCGAVVGVYPAAAPWLVLPVLAVALLAPDAPWWAAWRLRRLSGPGLWRRVGRAAVLLAVLAVSIAVVAPIQVNGALQNLTQIESLPVNATAAFFSLDTYAALFLGSVEAFGLLPGAALGWAGFAGVIVLTAVFALALAPGRPSDLERWRLVGHRGRRTGDERRRRRPLRSERRPPVPGLQGPDRGRRRVAGLVVIGLLPREGERPWPPRLLALGLVAAIWIPVSAKNLQFSAQGTPGFRSADVEMGRALDRLPHGSVILAEGAAPDDRSFQFRMMAAYFGDDAPDHTAVGLGTTGSYLTGGGAPDWLPAVPWTHVLTTRPQPIDSARKLIWSNSGYTLAAAPELDVTTYGTGWYVPEQAGKETFEWTSGPVQLVVSNRGAPARPAQLRMTVASQGRPRTLILTGGGRTKRVPLPAEAETPVTFDLDLPARSTTPVTLDAVPGGVSAKAVGDPRVLMVRVQDLTVVPR